MPWRNDPLILYHGTIGIFAADIENSGPNPTKCRSRRDFGKGFYTTRRLGQAREFANHRYDQMRSRYRQFGRGIDPDVAAVVQFHIDRNDLGTLDTLAFVLADTEWAEFVKNCRSGTFDHKGPGQLYDVVYGPVSTVMQDTERQYEQLSFHSPASISFLRFDRVERGGPRFI